MGKSVFHLDGDLLRRRDVVDVTRRRRRRRAAETQRRHDGDGEQVVGPFA